MNNLETYQTILEEQFSCNVGTFEEYATLEDFKFAYPTGDRIYIKSIPGSMDIMGVCSERCELSLLSNSLDDFTREVIAYSSKYIPSGYYFDQNETNIGTLSGSTIRVLGYNSGRPPFTVTNIDAWYGESDIWGYYSILHRYIFEEDINENYINTCSLKFTINEVTDAPTITIYRVDSEDFTEAEQLSYTLTGATTPVASGVDVDLPDMEYLDTYEIDIKSIVEGLTSNTIGLLMGYKEIPAIPNDHTCSLHASDGESSYPEEYAPIITITYTNLPIYLDFQNKGKELINGEWVSKLTMEGRWEL